MKERIPSKITKTKPFFKIEYVRFFGGYKLMDHHQILLLILHEFKRIIFYSPLQSSGIRRISDDFRGNTKQVIHLSSLSIRRKVWQPLRKEEYFCPSLTIDFRKISLDSIKSALRINSRERLQGIIHLVRALLTPWYAYVRFTMLVFGKFFKRTKWKISNDEPPKKIAYSFDHIQFYLQKSIKKIQKSLANPATWSWGAWDDLSK